MKRHKTAAHQLYDGASNDDGSAVLDHAGRHRLNTSLRATLLDAGLQQPGSVLYVLYVLGLILLKIDQHGRELGFLWSRPQWAYYGVLGATLALSGYALVYASHFLQLQPAGRLPAQAVRLISNLGLAAIVVCVALGNDRAAACIAILLLALSLGYRVLIAAVNLASAGVIAVYFLMAGLVALLLATLCVVLAWYRLPLNSISCQLLELGLIVQLSVLALALAQQSRRHQFACAQAEHLARHDALSGLFNRRAFLEMARTIWANAQRNHHVMSMIMIDLDHFKRINDQHGHEVGDRALVANAQLLEQACRSGDLLARWGGEEFLILLPETGLDQACAFAERVRSALEALGLPVESQSIFLTASFGVAESVGKNSLEDLIKAADLRLYDAKTQGRNRISSEHSAFFNSVLRA